MNNSNNDTASRLISIRDHLNAIGSRVGLLLRQSGNLPTVPHSTQTVNSSGYVGSSRRLTDEERADVVQMLKRPDLYTVQEIASKHRISRPSVYNIRSAEGLELHKRNRQTLIHA